MKISFVLVLLALMCFGGFVLNTALAQNSNSSTTMSSNTMSSTQSPHMGTWKLNEAKSKFARAAAKNTTVVYEAAGDDVKVTVDGVDAAGGATHNEWTGKFDGKSYAVTGDATSDMRSYRKINNHTLALTGTKDGKVSLTGRITVSANGRTRTVTTTATDSKGKKVTNTAVYDKQ